jgi:large subunit ribosomal protein L23
MDITSIILGEIVTEKSEQLKVATNRTYTLRVHNAATKIDVKNALKKFFDVDATSVRVMRTVPKTRAFGKNQTMTKRSRFKKALVTLSQDSKKLDLTTYKA